MNLRLLTLAGLFLAAGFQAQAQNADDSAVPKRSRDELHELLGPIALYPDPLVSLILPASTVPSDVVLAARAVKAGADAESLQDKPWDSSVKALARYPDTLAWLDENLEWTTQVGDAFVGQPADVMEAIQDLRAKAKSVGNLVDTPQQRIVQDDSDIRIVPSQPDAIYEPSYDPQVVYNERPVGGAPLLYFGAPLLVGSWLAYDFDWHRHHLYRGDWHEGWDYRHDGDRRGGDEVFVNNHLGNAREWHVDSRRRSVEVRHSGAGRSSEERPHVSIVRPTPLSNHISKGEVRRGEVVNGGRHDPVAGERRPSERGEHGKTIVPEGRARGESKGEVSKGHHEESRAHMEDPRVRHESAKAIQHDEAKVMHHDAPKVEHHDAPKAVRHEEANVVRHDAPKVEHRDAPKAVHHEEAKVMHHDAPKVEHHDAPKAPAHSDGKKKDDKKKE